jgi:hypothetical protein
MHFFVVMASMDQASNDVKLLIWPIFSAISFCTCDILLYKNWNQTHLPVKCTEEITKMSRTWISGTVVVILTLGCGSRCNNLA